jgi:hypothetical protein
MSRRLTRPAWGLANMYRDVTADQRLEVTAASDDFGTRNIRGNPATIDVGSAGGDCGSNIVDLMKCF